MKGRLYLSNLDERKALYEKYKMEKSTFEDKVDNRLNELNSKLTDMSLINVKKIKLNLEKSSLQSKFNLFLMNPRKSLLKF